jgi:hypothetical protein
LNREHFEVKSPNSITGLRIEKAEELPADRTAEL